MAHSLIGACHGSKTSAPTPRQTADEGQGHTHLRQNFGTEPMERSAGRPYCPLFGLVLRKSTQVVRRHHDAGAAVLSSGRRRMALTAIRDCRNTGSPPPQALDLQGLYVEMARFGHHPHYQLLPPITRAFCTICTNRKKTGSPPFRAASQICRRERREIFVTLEHPRALVKFRVRESGKAAA